MAIAPFLNWKKYTDKNFIKKIIFLSAVTFLGGTLLYLIEEKSIFALICGSLSIWLFTGVITDLISKIREAKVKFKNINQFFFFITKINLGIHLAHIGVAIFLAGVTGEQFYKSEYNVRKKVGDIINIGTKSLKFDKIENIEGPNYHSLMATFSLYEKNKFISKLRPEKRFYTNEKSQTTEAAILSDFWGDTYLVLGEGDNKTGWSLRIYSNPLVSWIWAGAFFMAVGGIFSVTQKSSRFRNV
jgi:cytochrome c-type biogenesis protein CcmF